MPAYCERLAPAVEGRVIRIGTCILLQMTINLVGVGMGVVKEAEYVWEPIKLLSDLVLCHSHPFLLTLSLGIYGVASVLT